jgi:hypothetical protein
VRVYISNFGKGNWAWPECYQRPALVVMDDVRVHLFWKARDRDGYIREAQKVFKQPDGSQLTRPVASRWFNLNDVFMETANDLWIHREKDELWWTISSDLPQSVEITDDPNPRAGPAKIYVYYKPCAVWSDKDRRGRRLTWGGLHPRAKEFLFTEGTCQQLAGDNAAYALALISGEPLKDWHNRPDWAAKVARVKRFPVTHFDARQKTIVRMAMTAIATVKASGSVSTTIAKEKKFQFNDQYDLERYISGLLDSQEGLCALTGISMILDGEDGDMEFACSLDRIDSNKHYERGNLQVVCRFANRWKSNSDNEDFLRLIEAVVSANAQPSA